MQTIEFERNCLLADMGKFQRALDGFVLMLATLPGELKVRCDSWALQLAAMFICIHIHKYAAFRVLTVQILYHIQSLLRRGFAAGSEKRRSKAATCASLVLDRCGTLGGVAIHHY